ncbi:MAG: hypothetical protein ACTTGX_03220 [Candidatus Cryptobacteroides sp.]
MNIFQKLFNRKEEEQDIAAISLAMHSYLNDSVHDTESLKITIKPQSSLWNNKALIFRKLPK